MSMNRVPYQPPPLGVLRAYTPLSVTNMLCTCLCDPVCTGSPDDARLVGWLHTTDCGITKDLLQREGEVHE